MADHTSTDWCNDSAVIDEIDSALGSGAIGCTTNPPLTYQVLSNSSAPFADDLARIPSDVSGNEKVVELIGVVVRKIADKLEPIYRKSGGKRGFVRAQVAPNSSADFDTMLTTGKIYASWGRNIKVKIPGTTAGIAVLEELSALGIPTNPTICVSVSQMIAAAEANERGMERAIAAGVEPGHSTSAYVLGRLQDYLAVINEEREAGLSTYDLECAVLAAAKRLNTIFTDRGYRQEIMPAAFRCARHVSELVGSNMVMTVHPSIQAKVIEADLAGDIRREPAIENPVDTVAVDRVLRALPEFVLAYEVDGIAIKDFDEFGATLMTLDSFDKTGWRKLEAMEIPR